MRKITSLLTMVLMGAMAFTFAGCDDDAEIAYTLEGTWEGRMYISSVFDGRTYDATYTEIEFLKDPYRYSSGDGYWVDYYDGAPWDYVANRIHWKVSDGSIRIDFRDEGSTIWIENYSLSDNYFRGTIYDGDNRVKFSLRHTSSPNWRDYEWGYHYNDYYYHYGDYYAKPGAMMAPAKTKAAPEAPKRIVRAAE